MFVLLTISKIVRYTYMWHLMNVLRNFKLIYLITDNNNAHSGGRSVRKSEYILQVVKIFRDTLLRISF